MLLDKTEKHDSIHAYFSLNEIGLLRLRHERAAKGAGATQKDMPALELGLSGEPGSPHKGRLDFVDLGMDPRTGTILLRGVFPNPDPAPSSRIVRVHPRADRTARQQAARTGGRAG